MEWDYLREAILVNSDGPTFFVTTIWGFRTRVQSSIRVLFFFSCRTLTFITLIFSKRGAVGGVCAFVRWSLTFSTGRSPAIPDKG